MLLIRKIATAFATSAIVLNAIATPAFAGTNIQISGNGENSNSKADINVTHSNVVTQNNTANVTNNVDVNSSTGGNKANGNTGGDVKIDTGDAKTNVTVSNQLNQNVAQLNCCPANDTTNVVIEKNGEYSKNKVYLDRENFNGIFQNNAADVYNDVYVKTNTGNNSAKSNTGGDVEIKTGDANSTVNVSTAANFNAARVGDGSGGGALSLKILGNGEFSYNKIDADLLSTTVVTQDNWAGIDNYLDVNSTTGKNKANGNTGGNVTIDTGDANVKANVNNDVNFNWADLNCGCLLDDLTAKIDGNGEDSRNKIDLDMSEGRDNGAFQANDQYLDNYLDDLRAKSGNNDAKSNTGWGSSDPVEVLTGDAGVVSNTSNSGNVNVVGSGMPDFHMTMDLSDLMDLLHWFHLGH